MKLIVDLEKKSLRMLENERSIFRGEYGADKLILLMNKTLVNEYPSITGLLSNGRKIGPFTTDEEYGTATIEGVNYTTACFTLSKENGFTLSEGTTQVTIWMNKSGGIKEALGNVTFNVINTTAFDDGDIIVSGDVAGVVVNLKVEIENLRNNKLDKYSTPSTLYAVGLSGLQEHIFYSHEPYPYSIPNRDANSQLKVPEKPIDDKHATSKKYVDETVANLNIQNGTGEHALIQKGEGQVASGEASVCFGSCGEGENRGAVGKYSAHFGLWNSATAERSIVGGGLCETTHDDSIVVGFGAKSSSNHCAVFGRCNLPNPNAYFQVGRGADVDHRENAFEVLSDGRVKAYGTPTENEDLTTKKYVDEHSGTKLYRHQATIYFYNPNNGNRDSIMYSFSNGISTPYTAETYINAFLKNLKGKSKTVEIKGFNTMYPNQYYTITIKANWWGDYKRLYIKGFMYNYQTSTYTALDFTGDSESIDNMATYISSVHDTVTPFDETVLD